MLTGGMAGRVLLAWKCGELRIMSSGATMAAAGLLEELTIHALLQQEHQFGADREIFLVNRGDRTQRLPLPRLHVIPHIVVSHQRTSRLGCLPWTRKAAQRCPIMASLGAMMASMAFGP